jgi:DNA processing protein
LKEGAHLCESVEDVLLQLYGEEKRPTESAPKRARRPPPPSGPALVVWRVLDPDEALDMDTIALRTGLSLDAVAEGVTLLEIDGRAVRVPGMGLLRA